MTDLSRTIAPKSDQLNADDLIAGPRTITVTRVAIKEGDDQPAAIYFEGDGGKPFKPCKSMRRVLVILWGSDTKAYTGRRMTLYRDDTVKFGGDVVGGIRISHVSDIERRMTMPLTTTRGKRAPFVVSTLTGGGQRDRKAELHRIAREKARAGSDAYGEWTARLKDADRLALEEIADELTDLRNDADDRPSDDDFPGNDAIRGEAA